MAAPLKDGLSYFPLDVDFLDDDKIRDILDKETCGARALLILMHLWNKIYGDKGYYLQVDDRTYKRVRQYFDYTGEMSEEYIKQVITECVKGGLFDETMFSRFGILTSARIQKSYLKGAEARNEIRIIKEYFLLDVEELSKSVLGKAVFKSVNEENNRVNLVNNSVNLPINPQSKVKENKVNKSKVERECVRHKYGEYTNVLLSEEELEKWKSECPQWSAYINNLSSYMKSTGKNYKDHLATLRNWYRNDKAKNPKLETAPSYDLGKVNNQPLVYKRRGEL